MLSFNLILTKMGHLIINAWLGSHITTESMGIKTQANEVSKDPRFVARVDKQTQQFIAQAAELSGQNQ